MEAVQTMSHFLPIILSLAVVFLLGGLALLMAVLYRRVVPTNEVHIIQSSKSTTSFGKDTKNGNTYYAWPSWIPVLGVTTRTLPTSVFDIDLHAYEAYDTGRLPFNVDVKAFFRIHDSNMAAQRVKSFEELESQLVAIVQGAVRVILASHNIEEILQGRSTFGNHFTKEVEEHLNDWGVVTVKSIELMDIRDSKDSQVIRNIMEKKKSHIEMQSRTEVASNKKAAEIAEIEAKREVDLQKQEAEQTVGIRTVEAKREVELKSQTMLQVTKEQQKLTKEKEMEVLRVEETRKAEIERDVQLVKAEQEQKTAIIHAEAEKEKTTLIAVGNLEAKKREAEGIKAEGEARAAAEQAHEMAPISAQIALAKEIGNNEGYQNYLVTVRRIEAEQIVGIEQAKALHKADVKVIANAGSAPSGVKSVMDLFNSHGGTELGGMLEALSQTPAGKALVSKVTGAKDAPAKKDASLQ